MRHLAALFIAILLSAQAVTAEPDFGENVVIVDPHMTDAQQRINAIFTAQERAQFGDGRHAVLFKPGRYELDIPVGFFTHIAGTGTTPDDVTIVGRVWTDAAWMNRNATCNFWRTVENLAIEPVGGVNLWAVSQAAPMRRTHVRGDLHLSAGGWASGGFLADCQIDGTVDAGGQQQWFSRNCSWSRWVGGAWNVVFAGCANPPVQDWPAKPVTIIEHTHDVREKPYLTCIGGMWEVAVPPLRASGSIGTSWSDDGVNGTRIPIERFHIAKAASDDAASINAALHDGKHLIITPGIYHLDEPLVVDHADTIVLGLGLPSLIPVSGKPALRVVAPEGAIISGLVIDAGEQASRTLVEFGLTGQRLGRAENPTCVHDLVCRVGGYGPGKAELMVAVHNDHLIGDNLWLWRADHGAHVGWDQNTCDTGLLVTGDDVTMYGLFVEHTQKHQTIWNGERGRVFFYQSEMPYDPPSQDAWRSLTGDGFASYFVGEGVRTHEAWGVGVYHVFQRASVVADNAIETPDVPGVRINHAFTFRLYGGKPGSGIRNVINGRGGEVINAQKATVK